MRKIIYCKTDSKGEQAFFVQVNGKSYYLFNQRYYKGVRDYFEKGIDINKLSSAVKYHNTAVRKTAENFRHIFLT